MSALRNRGAVGQWLHDRILPVHHAAQRRLHDLTYIFFELTQRCNLECRHCGSDCSRDVGQPDLPFQQVIDVLSEIRERHDPHRITVALTGGEPLLYSHFFALGKAITDLGFPWGMVTNGWAWTPRKVEAAQAAGMRTITVSLDGPAKSHDWLRGRAGSFERATECLAMLAAADWIQKLDVVTCVHRRNLHQLEELRAILEILGIKQWRLFTISPIGRAAQDPDLMLDPEGFQQLMQWTAAQQKNSGLKVVYSESGYLGPCDTEVRDHPFFCRAGVNVAGIMADGAILACPNIDRRYAQGNISHDNFCEVWEKGYQVFRDRRWMRNGPCVDCREWGKCQGNSFHLRDPETQLTRLCYVRDFELQSQ